MRGLLRRPILWIMLGAALLLVLFNPLLDEDVWTLLAVLFGLCAVAVLVVAAALWLRQRYAERRALLLPRTPDVIQQVEAEWSRAFAMLQRRFPTLGFLRADPLRSMPWILLMGPPRSGKDAALGVSGLSFEQVQLDARRGSAQMSECDLYLERKALFLKYQSSVALSASPPATWLAFLTLLRRYRSRRPLDAVALHLPLDELLVMRVEEQRWWAKLLRDRIDELTRHLGVRIPIYVIFSKLDLVDGFWPFWAQPTTGSDNRFFEQPFGFGITPNIDVKDLELELRQGMANLQDALLYRVPLRLSRLAADDAPGSHERREQGLYFPAEFYAYEATLCQFLNSLFAPQPHSETPAPRGIFFTSSARAELGEATLRRMRASAEKDAHLQTQRVRTDIAVDHAGFFQVGLFQRIVEQAQDAVRPSKDALRSMRLQLAAATAALFLSCVFATYVIGYRCRKDRDWLAEVESTALALSKKPVPALTPEVLKNGPEDPQAIETARALQAELRGQARIVELLSCVDAAEQKTRREGPCVGLERALPDRYLAPADRAVNDLLAARTEAALLLPLGAVLDAHMGRGSLWRGEPDKWKDFAVGFDALRLVYILRHKERQCSALKDDEGWRLATQKLRGLWEEQLAVLNLGQDDEPRLLDWVLSHYFRRYVIHDEIRTGLTIASDKSQPAVERTRANLAKESTRPGSEHAAKDRAEVDFYLRASSRSFMQAEPQIESSGLFRDPPIEHLYSDMGCHEFFNPLDNSGQIWGQCVLGLTSLDDDLKTAGYQKHFLSAWQQWAEKIKINEALFPAGGQKGHDALIHLEPAVGMLDRLVHDGDLGRLLQVMGHGKGAISRAADETAPVGDGVVARVRGFIRNLRQNKKQVTQELRLLADDLTPCKEAHRIYMAYAEGFDAAAQQAKNGAPNPGKRSLYDLYNAYLDKAAKLRDVLYAAQQSGATEHVLRLASDTASSKGALYDLMLARHTMMAYLKERVRRGPLPSGAVEERSAEWLELLLINIEQRIWQALVPAAERALENDWQNTIWSRWVAIKAPPQDPQQDPIRCQRMVDFLSKDVSDYRKEKLKPYFETLEPPRRHLVRPPFDRPPIGLVDSAVNTINIALAAATRNQCPQGPSGGGGGPRPATSPRYVEVNHPETLGCNIAGIQYDDGQSSWDCDLSDRGCTLRAGEPPTMQAQLRVMYRVGQTLRPWRTIFRSASSEALLSTYGRPRRDGTYVFELPPMGEKPCTGFQITLTMANAGGGGGGQASTWWHGLVLPTQITRGGK